MNKMTDFLVAVVLLMFVGVDCIQWKSCDASGRSKIANVSISDCEQTPICILKKGTNVTISVAFTINEDSKTAKVVVHGIVSGVPVPFPPDNPDGCKDSNLQCPLKNGNSYVYKTAIYIKKSYPKMKLVVKWELQDDNSNDIFCVEVPVEIEDSSTVLNKNQIL